MAPHYKWMIFAIFLGLASWAAHPQNACAGGTIASQTCDTQVWRTMEARARLETEREMMQNQNLIFKPDSILSYMCFDKMAGHAAANVGVLFTHTTYWGGKEIIKWGDQGTYKGMDKAMQDVVIASLKPFVEGNFPHSYFGGRGDFLSAQKAPVTDISGKGGTYSCGEMAKVWKIAKCMNFLHVNAFAITDGFYPFVNLKAGSGGTDVEGYETKKDVRDYPSAMKCDGEPITGSTWKDMNNLSRNENSFGDPNNLYKYGEPLQQAFQDVRKKVDPGTCGDAIQTGITVILGPGSTSTYQDGVCTNPGCTYNKSGKCQ